MDDYDSFINGNNGQINPVYDLVRKNLGDTVDYARRFSDLALMLPDPKTASTRYALVNAGQEYLVYFPDDENESLKKGASSRSGMSFVSRLWSKLSSQPKATGRSFDVKMRAGTYYREWFDPTTAKRLQDILSCGEDGSVVFTIPVEMTKDVVVYVKRKR
jgi:hypothetical protein